MANWRKDCWVKLSPWGKIWHIMKVILTVLIVGGMFLLTTWFVLAVLGLGHLVFELRDKILLNIMHMIFG